MLCRVIMLLLDSKEGSEYCLTRNRVTCAFPIAQESAVAGSALGRLGRFGSRAEASRNLQQCEMNRGDED